MTKTIISTLALAGAMPLAAQPVLTAAAGQSHPIIQSNKHMNNSSIRFRTVKVDGLDIFYREAGDPSKPAILLLHGFPSSSHMFRDLMNDLAGSYYLVAPDYPGFGQSSAPDAGKYDYTFDNLAKVVSRFTEQVGLKRMSLYMHDYGGPVGFRLAAQNPASIQALIVQNANAYSEGMGEALKPLASYVQDPNAETEKAVRNYLAPETIKWLYTEGAEHVSRISPDGHMLDQHYISRAGNDQIQLALFRNYGTNLALYDAWHEYFRKHQPPTLVISGKNDPLFIAPGAMAFKKDNPDAEINLLNGGHFVLEEKHAEAAALIKSFLQKKGIR